MNIKRLQKIPLTSSLLVAACLLIICLLSIAWQFSALRHPRAWKTSEVPITFWSWRSENPAQAEVERAMHEAGAQTLFLHAGQIDCTNTTLQRIRPVTGTFPRRITLHLVYNGTRALLANFERLEPDRAATMISETYAKDAARAASDQAQVAGLQLDFDVPTRLLPRYAQMLRLVRAHLPPRARLSITGLPTWIDAPQIEEVLAAVDFWIPQCYGAGIPDQLQKAIPIASTPAIANTIARVRRLGHPFYAGIPAYGYALLYSQDGALVNLHGNLNPSRVALHPNFELVERRAFGAKTPDDDQVQSISEWRYVYRALSDDVVDGLAVHTNDYLVLDVPVAESFRAYVRAVREEAGESLLGICIFRLPVQDDATTLTIQQIAMALTDSPTLTETNLRLERGKDSSGGAANCPNCLNVMAVNSGTASALIGADAFVLTLRVPAGSVRGITSIDGFTSFETLCDTDEMGSPRPCGLSRANVVRLKTQAWMSGASAQTRINIAGELPDTLNTSVTMKTDEERTYRNDKSISITTGNQQ